MVPLDKHDSLNVPSAAVRDNDPRCNPLGPRRFNIIRSLAHSLAVQVPEGTGDNVFGKSPPCISIIDHLYCPSSVHASIGDNVHSFAHSVYQVKDVHARAGLSFPSFERSFDGSKDNEHYLRTILFLDAFLQHYSLHSVLPKVLVHDLATGSFYAGLSRYYWLIHLRKAQMAFQRVPDHRAFLTEDRFLTIQAIPALSYSDMTDEQLWIVSCTIQQLLVEHALYLTGPMTMERIQHAEDILQYYPPTSHLNLTITNFVGFNVRQLHENLLKFHYHKNGGILHANEGFFNHARALLTKLDNSLFPWDDASTLSWTRWLRHVLGHVVDMIGIYFHHYLIGYMIEDKNRVAFPCL